MSEAQDSMLGMTLDGRYTLTEFISEGGMGRVYRAEQKALHRKVAVKLLKENAGRDHEFQQRFFLEASLCSRLSHPNTIRIFDYGCHEDRLYYIVMELLEGQSVLEIIRQSAPLSPDRAIFITSQVCLALIEAHGAGMVHRDLKPSNLFASPDGMGGERIKILDFGVVKEVGADVELTQLQSVVGSPQYMAPEQIRGESVDGRADLYSLGAILCQLLTGRVPFPGRDPMGVLMKHLTDPIPLTSDLNPRAAVPEVLEEIMRKALAKLPEQRFANAQAMLAALNKADAEIRGVEVSALEIPKWEGEALSEMVTGLLDQTTQVVVEASTDPTLSQLEGVQLEGYVAYIDLNCPYCYALFERVNRWGLADQIEWRMVEHASHVLEGDFDLVQEELLSNEVFEVHHRAPDVELSLPLRRCQSTLATHLIAVIERLFPEKTNPVRAACYGALWRDGRNIGDPEVLSQILDAHDLPSELLSMCDEPPEEFLGWQRAWEQGEYDHSIPVLAHPASGRVIIGLADQASLARFLLGDHSRVIDRSVCFYQPKPTLLLCGWLNKLWPLLAELKDTVEIIQAPTWRKASELLGERAPPALLLIQDEHLTRDEMAQLGTQARSRSVPWLVACTDPDPERELDALSLGAAEVLPVGDDMRVARARISRVMMNRVRFQTDSRRTDRDTLTGLPSRQAFLGRLEEEWKRAQEKGAALGIALLNIDGFKAFNRAHGYVTGDQVLVEIARGLQRSTGGLGSLLARFGGNEFVVLISGADVHGVEEVARTMVEVVQQADVLNGAAESAQALTASMGVYVDVPSADGSMYVLVDGAHRNLAERRTKR